MSSSLGLAPSPPGLKPLARIGPSRSVALRECPLREVWAANRVAPALPRSAQSRLGTVVHRVLARSSRTTAGSGESVEDLWEEELEAVETEMRAIWFEARLAPLAASSPDFEVRRLRAVAKGRELAAQAVRSVGGGVGLEGCGHELWVQSKSGCLAGFVDQVRWDGGLVIRDFKSGAISSLKGDDEVPTIRQAYVEQVRLYASLYRDTFGRWPDRLELVPLSGEAIELPMSARECEEAAADAERALAKVNEVIRCASSSLDCYSLLATPTAEACRGCLFRPMCGPYSVHSKDAAAGWPVDVVGCVELRREAANGSIAFSIRERGGESVSIRGLQRGDRHPGLDDVTVGATVGLFNLSRSFPSNDLRAGLYTTIYRYPS